MRRWLWCGLLVTGMGTGLAGARGGVLDSAHTLASGLSLRSVCAFTPPEGVCFFSGDPDGPAFRLSVDGGIGRSGAQRDALGAWYQFDEVGYLCGSISNTALRLFRVHPDDTSELVMKFSECGRQVSVKGFVLDAINGTLLFVGSSNFTAPELIELRGLTTVRDVVPQGPAGPQGLIGPQRPQGPPGTPADPAQVLALQQQVNALQLTLQQIENLPTIKRLLEKVQQLEQAVP